MAANTLPPVEYLRECFEYNPETGELVWKQRPPHHFARPCAMAAFNQRCRGKPTKNKTGKGYYYVCIDRTMYRVHRIIYKLVTAQEPPHVVDHINGDRLDNRWSNLRGASRSQNQFNMRRNVLNSTGYKGVHFRPDKVRKKFSAEINAFGRKHRLGYFLTPEEAHAAYCAKARELHGEFFNPG